MTSTESRPYHHGDLRRALVQAARQLLETEGPEALSLRAVARQAGVSPAAPYHHFKDKSELLAAVADEGFAELAEELRRTYDAGPAGPGRIAAMGATYVAFALDQRPLYRVMIATTRSRDQPPAPGSPRHQVMSAMREGIIDASEPGASEEDLDLANLAAWAAIHGLADLTTFRLIEPIKMRMGGDLPFARAVMEHLGVFAGQPRR